VSRYSFLTLTLLAQFSAHAQPAPRDQLSEALLVDIGRLQVTYCLLESYADSLWPGWNGYKGVPFHFVYPNQVEMMVGQSATPPGFHEVNDKLFPGLRVLVNRERETITTVTPPIVGGGVTFANFQTRIQIKYPPALLTFPWMEEWHTSLGLSREESFRLLHSSDGQILVYIHELFHAHQNTFPKADFTLPIAEPNADVSAYSEVEGIALERAFLEPKDALAKTYVLDFLVAREVKHRLMTRQAIASELHAERSEGLATYVQFAILRYLNGKDFCQPTAVTDPHFFNFRDSSYFLVQELENLRRARSSTLEGSDKPYRYGHFEARLLDRFRPDWKRDFLQKGSSLDQVLRTIVEIDSTTKALSEIRLSTVYNVQALRNVHAQFMIEGAKVVESTNARKGTVYILDFSGIGHIDFKARRVSYSYNNREKIYCPSGIERVDVGGVSLTTGTTPFVIDSRYYLRWIDESKTDSMKIDFARRDENGIYHDATMKTEGFTVKGARVRITKTEKFTKLSFLPVMR
jgi:hypothetical protein